MNNISCQQLTGALQRIQELMNDCDDLNASNVLKEEKIKKFLKLKQAVEDISSKLLIEIHGMKFYHEEYDSLISFLKENGVSDYLSYIEIFFNEHSKPDKGYISKIFLYGMKIVSTAALNKLKNLNEVVIENCSIEEKSFRDFPAKNIQKIKFKDCYNSTINFDFLKSCSNLSYLDVTQTNFNYEDLKMVAKLPIKTLIMKHCDNLEIYKLNVLLDMKKLEMLSILHMARSFEQRNEEIFRQLGDRGIKIIGWNY